MGRGGTLLLVVDDDEPTREALRELLEAEGHDVVTAANGAEAAARMSEQPRPDLAIIDLMLPVMDGWALVSRLRSDPQHANLPVIIVSAFGQRALANAPAAAAHLSKPLRAETLLQEVRSALEGRGSLRPVSPSSSGEATPIRASGPYPLLQQAAEETALELGALATAEANDLASGLRVIGAEIRRWRPDHPPTDQHRTQITDNLIGKIRRAFALLGRSGTIE